MKFDNDEAEVNRYFIEDKVGELVQYPNSKLTRKKKDNMKLKDDVTQEHRYTQRAVDKFLLVLNQSNLDGDNEISKSELKDALNTLGFESENFKLLIGEDSTVDNVFDVMDVDGNASMDVGKCNDYKSFPIRGSIKKGHSSTSCIPTHRYDYNIQNITDLKFRNASVEDKQWKIILRTMLWRITYQNGESNYQ